MCINKIPTIKPIDIVPQSPIKIFAGLQLNFAKIAMHDDINIDNKTIISYKGILARYDIIAIDARIVIVFTDVIPSEPSIKLYKFTNQSHKNDVIRMSIQWSKK